MREDVVQCTEFSAFTLVIDFKDLPSGMYSVDPAGDYTIHDEHFLELGSLSLYQSSIFGD
ncbi:unnamed protein product [marine sediment metagenome]|uniref:Uncharacterized protein n=1 Tax=marine sediment metagenome TaxID=412755 RepID=X1H1D0_9ZZZZ